MNAQQTALKNQLLEACYVKQQALINDFKIRIKALLQVDGLGNEEENDNNQQANVSQNITEADALNQELIFANEEMKSLRKLESMISVRHNCVEFGAVVKTDKRTFFISTSIEEPCRQLVRQRQSAAAGEVGQDMNRLLTIKQMVSEKRKPLTHGLRECLSAAFSLEEQVGMRSQRPYQIGISPHGSSE